jgi:RimJ/RimL family protein N-acetyltransferase
VLQHGSSRFTIAVTTEPSGVPLGRATVDLLTLDSSLVEEIATDPLRLAERGVDASAVVEVLRDTARATIDFYRRSGAEPPWASYLAIDSASTTVVGTCSFVGPPGSTGAVEIAYFTFPPFEGRGYAAAMALALVDRALQAGGVTAVVANTLTEENASVRVLRRLGFEFAGEAVDDEAGVVWQWRLPLAPPDTGRPSVVR